MPSAASYLLAVSEQEVQCLFFHGEKEMLSANFMDGGLDHATFLPMTNGFGY